MYFSPVLCPLSDPALVEADVSPLILPAHCCWKYTGGNKATRNVNKLTVYGQVKYMMEIFS